MTKLFRGRVDLRLAIISLCVLALGAGMVHAAQAPDGNSVLVFGNSVRKAASSVEAVEAAAAGYTVVVASKDEWAAMTPAEFATYRAIVLGDGMCLRSGSLAAAIENRNVWGGVVTGNVIAIGTHPGSNARVRPDARMFVQDALRFAAGGQGTGAYVTLGCYMSLKPTDVLVLEPFGEFSVVRQNGCSGDVQVVGTDPALSNLSNAGMSGWKCTSDASFVKWPESFEALTMAANVPGQFIGQGGVTGAPSILARGEGFRSILCGNGTVDGVEGCDDGNLTPGDGCSGRCRVEGSLQSAEAGVGTNLGEVVIQGISITPTISFPMSGSHDLYNQPIDVSDSGWGFQGNLRLYTGWNPESKINLAYDPTKVRQGETPGMVDTLDPGHGDLCVGIEADFSVLLDGNSVDVGGVSESMCGDCPLGFGGDPAYPCTIGEQDFQIICMSFGVVGLCIDMTLRLDSTVSPWDFSTDRTVLYDGTPTIGPDTFTFPPNPHDDPFRVACTIPEGTAVAYQLADPRTGASINFNLVLGVAGQACDPITFEACTDVVTADLLTIPVGEASMDLNGPTGQADIGTVQKDVTPPDLTNVNSSYSGDEGTPIQFSAAGAVDSCLDTIDWIWDFSDHGVAYGFNPFHTFEDDATYSGRLGATDLAGNRSTKGLTIDVSNVPPVAHAGPNTSALWGVPVAFNGSATDPGADDQATLRYQWSFGDGTPSATGGPSVQHAYAAPGTYVATLTVCDKEGACDSDTLVVLVHKRDVTIGYLGDQHGVYDTMTNLTASLVDELGSIVPGRTIEFGIGPEAGGSAATSSSGIASKTHLLGLVAGTYAASAAFAGDSLYNPATSSTATYTVDRKPTSVTYTGALNGGPNKTISLSAVLKDGQNKPLAGRLITFQLGSQSASATTDASGVATKTLKLSQKNGNYSLKSTFTPDGTDVDRYVGSVASVTFKLQAK